MWKFISPLKAEEATCKLCDKRSKLISKALSVCLDCIRNKWTDARSVIERVHEKSRKRFNLPLHPPNKGVRCGFCVNDCRIKENEFGYCGIRKNINNRIHSVVGERAIVEAYYDPLPTNCVAAPYCEGSTRLGYKNLAVFYGACTFNCLFCQNWHYRELLNRRNPTLTPEELADKVDKRTFCICYFGGDPTPQALHALKTSALTKNVRICWETNGSMSRGLLKKIADLALATKGTIKFDLKAWDEKLHIALTSVSNNQTLENFKWLGGFGADYNFQVASTLLVPGYVDEQEVESLARFIAEINPKTPYVLLGFYPHFYLSDMPTTSRKHAYKCMEIAKKYLKNVRIGNEHLLS